MGDDTLALEPQERIASAYGDDRRVNVDSGWLGQQGSRMEEENGDDRSHSKCRTPFSLPHTIFTSLCRQP